MTVVVVRRGDDAEDSATLVNCDCDCVVVAMAEEEGVVVIAVEGEELDERDEVP